MSTTEAPRTAEPAMHSAARRRLVAYLVVRLTGLLLAVLVVGHLLVTHVVTDVAGTNASFIAKRWGSAVWLTWDWLMLAAALGHAGAGVWMSIDDYARTASGRRQLHRGLVLAIAALFVLGSFVIAKAVYS